MDDTALNAITYIMARLSYMATEETDKTLIAFEANELKNHIKNMEHAHPEFSQETKAFLTEIKDMLTINYRSSIHSMRATCKAAFSLLGLIK